MSAKFFSFVFVLMSCVGFSQENSCTKDEVITRYASKNETFKKAYSLLQLNKTTEAFVIIDELLDKAKNSNNTLLKINVLFLEAELFYKNKSFKKSLSAYKRLLENESVSDDIKFYALLNIGNIYFVEFNNYDQGLFYFNEAKKLTNENSCSTKLSSIYITLANQSLINKKYIVAEDYYKKSFSLYLKDKKYNAAASACNNLGNLYFEQYQDKKAETYFLKAINVFPKKDSTSLNLRRAINFNLSAVYEALGAYKKSLSYLNKSNVLKDSIWNRDKVWELADLSKKLAVDKKNQELAVLAAENKAKNAQRNAILVSALVLLILLVVSIYFYREKVKRNKIISDQNETLDSLNATKDKLFSIVSHDLRSSVNALKTSNRNLVLNLETKNLDKLGGLLNTNSAIVNGAYGLLDNLLNWAMLQTKQAYFNIEEHRLFMLVEHVSFNYQALFSDKNIAFANTVSKKEKVLVDHESLKIILRNLIDNAIKFTEVGGQISIYSNSENDRYINLIIEDTGLGMKKETRLELLKETALLSKKENEEIIGTGLGMQLVKSMIKKNNGKFNIESQLGKGTKMIVSLPKVTIDG